MAPERTGSAALMRAGGSADGFFNRLFIEEVDFHSGVDDDLLRGNSARRGTQKKNRGGGGLDFVRNARDESSAALIGAM